MNGEAASESLAWRGRALLIVALLVSGAAIEVFLQRGFVRYTVGDVLVAAMIYLLFRAVRSIGPARAVVLSLILTFSVEAAQALRVLDRLGMPRTRLTNVIFGTTFTWGDLMAYTVGIAAGFSIDRLLSLAATKMAAGPGTTYAPNHEHR